MPAQPSADSQPRRLLVRGVNWLGDAVMTTPALQRLREALPGTRITLLTHEKLEALWQGHPSLDAVVPFNPGERPWSIARRLRGEKYDAALVLPNSPRAGLEVWLAGIPQRMGYARPWRNWLLTRAVAPRPGYCRMRKRSTVEINRLLRLHTDAPEPGMANTQSPAAHQIHEYLHLAAVLGANPVPLSPRLEISAAEIQQAESMLFSLLRQQQKEPVPGRLTIFLGLNPGAQYGPAKCWPAESFAAVARAVSGRVENCQWLALGSAADASLCSGIAQTAGGGVVNLAGKTSLRELMAVLKVCRALLTNDSGSMHVAAALGTPVVVPFGSTASELTGPGLPGDPRHRLLHGGAPCSPCFRRTCPIDLRCMTSITPSRVIESVLQVLSQEQPARGRVARVL